MAVRAPELIGLSTQSAWRGRVQPHGCHSCRSHQKSESSIQHYPSCRYVRARPNAPSESGKLAPNPGGGGDPATDSTSRPCRLPHTLLATQALVVVRTRPAMHHVNCDDSVVGSGSPIAVIQRSTYGKFGAQPDPTAREPAPWPVRVYRAVRQIPARPTHTMADRTEADPRASLSRFSGDQTSRTVPAGDFLFGAGQLRQRPSFIDWLLAPSRTAT